MSDNINNEDNQDQDIQINQGIVLAVMTMVLLSTVTYAFGKIYKHYRRNRERERDENNQHPSTRIERRVGENGYISAELVANPSGILQQSGSDRFCV
jgi:cbb3-type cytochrome oxidase subunit 3